MRNKSLALAASALFLATTVMAQSIEYDDMYFNGKDRKKLKEKEASEQAAFSQSPASRHNKSNGGGEVYADNSDATTSYSARNQNPEFTSRSKSKAATDEDDYYSSSYSSSYNKSSGYSQFNNSYGNWYNSPWVANNYWGSSIYGWNTPYYGSYYDSWGNPWMNPYYGSGWSTSFSFYGGGNPYGYGMMNGVSFGLAYAFGNPYHNSWSGWGYPYSSAYGYGSPYGYGGYGYGGGSYYNNGGYTIIDNGQNYAYGKRGTSNGAVTRRQATTRPNVQPVTSGTNNGTIGNQPVYNGSAGGRMAATSSVSAPSRGQVTRQDDYYNRNWRTARQADVYGGSSYSQPSRSSQSGWNNSSWNNNNNNSSNQNQWNRSSGFDSGRSSYSNGNSGGGLHSSGSSGGGGVRTRVRD
ncbi:hypothetical protein WBG78_12515 [Chryseolinea sp. T2]|uniref:hypothetical protein n=1 Tax=Chryseolinea sp. T2 TaxID=3129255 RepID=UPI003077D528